MTGETQYVVRDAEDREVARETTFGKAMRTAKHYGPGATVLGAKGQIKFVVKSKKEAR